MPGTATIEKNPDNSIINIEEPESVCRSSVNMKNSNLLATIENARACRKKAASLRENIDYSSLVRARMEFIAAQWDELASEYESSIPNGAEVSS